jgi:hypothetical protein
MINSWIENAMYFSVSYLMVGYIITKVNQRDYPKRLKLHDEFLRMAPHELAYYQEDSAYYARQIQAITEKTCRIRAEIFQWSKMCKSKHSLLKYQLLQTLLWPGQFIHEIIDLFKRSKKLKINQATQAHDGIPHPKKTEVIALDTYHRFQRQKTVPSVHATRSKHGSL